MKQLYPFQLQIAQAMSARAFVLNKSDVGTGKTAMAIGSSPTGSVLVVCPKSVQQQWVNEWEAFVPNMAVFKPFGGRSARTDAIQSFLRHANSPRRVLVCTYEQIKSHASELAQIDWSMIHADEVHRIGNPKTQAFKAMASLKATRRYGYSATPLRSSPLQAYGIFTWLSPGLLGKNYYHFLYRYTVKNAQNWTVGFQNLDELAERLAPHCIGITLEQAGYELPPIVEEDITFTLSAKERRLYDQIRKELLLEIEKIEISKIENPSSLQIAVVKLGKLQELCDSMELLGEGVESSKLETLKDHLSDVLGE